MKRLAAILLFATLAAACGKDPFFDPNVGISVDPTSLSLHIGESATITASVTPEDLPNKNVLWTTDNTSVAKVSGGVVSAVGVGSATITAKTDWGGRTAKCRVTVLSPVLVESVNLGRSALSLDPKAGPFTFSPSIMPEDATDKGLSWTSSDESVVAVSDGVVTVKGKGTATVTATAQDAGHASASCTVTVVNISDAVDLGLSVKWASFNLGADSPETGGDFYAWGELAPKSSYAWSDYKYSSSASGPFSKYNPSDGKSRLEASDDVASVMLGEGWRTPTREECEELMNGENCSWEFVTGGSQDGFRVTGKKDGYTDKSIFLPVVGYMENSKLIGKDDVANFWSSTVTSDPAKARSMGMSSAIICGADIPRYIGFSIRPVKE